MLSITGMDKFYYIKNFTDIRCMYNMTLVVVSVRKWQLYI